METIKVNMNPNPLDVQTIHASQNDGEARQWEFELHNNGELIDTSDITEQLFFKAYKGGTEQLLPENTSTPTTSPFKGDIRYPQGLLTDQEFTYRQSPTEEDGLAKITDIKGNTLVWNQLVQNGNFADASNWTTGNATLSVSSNKATLTVTNNGTVPFYQTINQKTAEHKVLVLFNAYASRSLSLTVNWGNQLGPAITLTTSNQRFSVLYTIRQGGNNNFNLSVVAQTGDVINYSNVQLFDLTQMGLDITSPSDFTSLFPLSYYSYNQGSLLSFMGNGIKTVGKNLLKLVDKSGTYNGITYSCAYNVITLKGTASGASVIDFSIDGGFLRLYPRFQYTKGLSPVGIYNGVQSSLRGQNADFVTVGFWTNNANPLTMSNLNADAYYFRIQINSGVSVDCTLSAQLEIGNVATAFEPYTSSTLSLPISTYFPNGMKSAGTVYDELTPAKAVTRIGAVNLGSLDWIHRTEIGEGIFSCDVTSTVLYKRQPSVNFEVAKYINGGTVTGVTEMVNKDNKTLCVYHTGNNTNRYIYIKDTSFSNAMALKNSLQGVYLYYELATPTETSFTTASLVTENAEIPLSNNDGTLIGKCTEQLSAEPGFHDAKIKLSDDDGTCYSNKLQLHVERSPQ